MKTMGFDNLNLVNPKCKVNEISYAMASNAGDVLDNLKIYQDIHEAIGECKYVMGSTARQRDIPIEIVIFFSISVRRCGACGISFSAALLWIRFSLRRRGAPWFAAIFRLHPF